MGSRLGSALARIYDYLRGHPGIFPLATVRAGLVHFTVAALASWPGQCDAQGRAANGIDIVHGSGRDSATCWTVRCAEMCTLRQKVAKTESNFAITSEFHALAAQVWPRSRLRTNATFLLRNVSLRIGNASASFSWEPGFFFVERSNVQGVASSNA